MNLITRAVLALAAIIASWFVATDALNFPVFQMVIASLLIVAVVTILAFWRRR